MVPKAVADAGYTAVGLGVLALQQVQTQRRVAVRRASSVVGAVRSALGPVGRVVDLGRSCVVGIVRSGR